MPPLFVYGSLKQGFPNFHVNQGVRIAGEFQTLQAYPLMLADLRLPCLLPLPGQGMPVRGQLFAVTAEALARMDALERVGEPGGYSRQMIEVVNLAASSAPALEAYVYMQQPDYLSPTGTHAGPLAEYTLDHAQSLRW